MKDTLKKIATRTWGALIDLKRGITGLEAPVDIEEVMARVENLLNESIEAKSYVIREPTADGARVHLGQIDFEALARYFKRATNKATTAEALTSATAKRVDTMVRLNPTRSSLREQLEVLIADYNAGAQSVGAFFEKLLAFIKKLEEEERRAEGEGVSQEQLAFGDLLTSVEVNLSKDDLAVVRKIAEGLPSKLEKASKRCLASTRFGSHLERIDSVTRPTHAFRLRCNLLSRANPHPPEPPKCSREQNYGAATPHICSREHRNGCPPTEMCSREHRNGSSPAEICSREQIRRSRHLQAPPNAHGSPGMRAPEHASDRLGDPDTPSRRATDAPSRRPGAARYPGRPAPHAYAATRRASGPGA